MSQSESATPSPEYGDSLMTVVQFAARYPHLYANANRVRWLIRDRSANGLAHYGAVMEVFNNGERPRVFIHTGNWFRWMQAGGSRAPRKPGR